MAAQTRFSPTRVSDFAREVGELLKIDRHYLTWCVERAIVQAGTQEERMRLRDKTQEIRALLRG